MSLAVAGAAQALCEILPRERIHEDERAARWTVGDAPASVVVLPESVEEAAAVLGRAGAEGWKVALAGAGTRLRGTKETPDLVLSAARMTRVVEYEPADLTITVEAGTTMEELAATVAAEGQWLPLDPPGEGATIGATMGTGRGGPLAAAWGAPRDLAIGLRAVTGDGRAFNAGGRVVKNVAGFDLVRLLVGSGGTLAFLAEVTVRLYPLPQVDRTLVLRARRLEDLLEASTRAAAQPFIPAAIELLERRGAAGDRGEALLAIRLVGGRDQVEAEAELLRTALGGSEPEALGEAAAREVWGSVRDLDRAIDLSLRLSLPPARLGETVELARQVGRMRDAHDALARSPLRIAVHAGSGTLRLTTPNLRTDSGWDDRWAERLDDLRRTLAWRGGALDVVRAPAAVLDRLPPAPVDPVRDELTRGLRLLFDPSGTLSVDRFLLGVGAGDRG